MANEFRIKKGLIVDEGSVTFKPLSAGYLQTDSNGLVFAASLPSYQPLDADLTAIAALAGTTGFLKKTAADTWTLDTTTYESTANKGQANGYAPLDGTAKIAAQYLPAYVDDVLEYANQAAFPATGTAGIIYVTLDTNRTYRWSGSVYVEIAASPGTTDSVTEGSTNLYFTTARVLATALTGYSVGANTALAATDTILQAFQKLQGQLNNKQASGSYQPLDADLTSIAALSGTSGFLKTNGAGTWTVDTSTYITGNQSITLSGEASGSGATAITVTLSNSAVIGKVLTGYAVGTNAALAATDTILGAFGKLEAQIASKQASGSYVVANGAITGGTATKITYDAKGLVTAGAAATTTDIGEGSNLYFTNARAIAAPLTGFSTATSTAVVATDTILAAIGKLQAQNTAQDTTISGKEPTITAGTTTQYWRGDKSWQTLNTTAVAEGTSLYFTNARVIIAPLTGYTIGSNTALAATDTILAAFGKLEGQIASKQASGSYVIANGAITGGTATKITYDAKGLVTAGAAATTTDIGEGTNLYFTNARTLAATLTGYSVGTNTAIGAADSVLGAFQKLQGQINNLAGVTNNKTQALTTGSNVIISLAKATYKSLFIEYVIYNGTNQRSGSVVVSNDGVNTPVMTEMSTNDIGNTSAIATTIAYNVSNLEFSFTGVPDNSYTTRVIYRYI